MLCTKGDECVRINEQTGRCPQIPTYGGRKGVRILFYFGLVGLNILKEAPIGVLLVQLKFILNEVLVGVEHMDAAGVDQTRSSSTAEGKERNLGKYLRWE